MDTSSWWPAVGALAGAVTTLAGLGVLIARMLRHITNQNDVQLKQNDEFRADWYGRPARPGVPSESGVMERLGSIEAKVDALPDRVTRVEQRLDDHVRLHGGLPPTT